MWSGRYDREMQDIFAIQDEVARDIANVFQWTLGPARERVSHNPTTSNVQAYDYYLRGRKYFYQLTRRGLEFARQMFESASELDSSYALAYAGIADSCSFLSMWFDRSLELLETADAASRKALALAPELAQAHASRGLALSLNRKYDEAEREFELAIHQDPKLFEAHYFYARDSVAQGKLEKAARLFKRASEIRPEDYQTPLLLSQVYRGLGMTAEAEVAGRKGIEIAAQHLELNPEDTRALYLGAAALVIYGDSERGLEWAQRAATLDPEEQGMLYQLACIYSLAGEVEDAITYLERWEEKGALPKEWLDNDPDLDRLRDHPRFRALRSKLR
jgi:tetratricopeptide (TPR) repeat protein